MDDEIRKSLLTKKSAPFQKLHQECQIKLQRIKQKNDFLQKQIGVEVEQEMKKQVRKQKQFLEKQINMLKEIMNEMGQRFKNPECKNKLKTIKVEAQKQIQRNKVILKDLITKSFLKRSIDQGLHHEDMDQYMEGGKVNYGQFGINDTDDFNMKKMSMLTEEQRQIEIDYDIQKKIQDQKNALLNEVQQSTLRNNQIMNDMAIMVDQQGQNLDIIHQQLEKTNKNAVLTNQSMQQAEKIQKKSRKKYCLFAVLILMCVAIVIGIVFILQ